MQLTWLPGAPSRPVSAHQRVAGQGGLGSPATQLMRAVRRFLSVELSEAKLDWPHSQGQLYGPAMDDSELRFERFSREHYDDYLGWFADEELNRRLGPMDDEWLTAILEESEEQGITWAVFVSSELVGVIETVFSPGMPCAITAIAVKPARLQQGLASSMLRRLFSDYEARGIETYLAYVEQTNVAASRLLINVGFRAVSAPNDKGYVEFRRNARASQ